MRRQPGGQGAAQGGLQPLGQMLLQLAGLEGAQIQLQTLQPVPAAGGTEFAEHSLQQGIQGGVMQAAEPFHDAAGQGLLAGGELQLQAMQPVAGRGWGVIPLMRGEGQQGDAEFTVRAIGIVTPKSVNSKKFIQHDDSNGVFPEDILFCLGINH